MVEFNFLKTTSFKLADVWDCKKLLNKKTYTSKYPLLPFSEVLKDIKIEWENIVDDKKYSILGVHAYGEGVYIYKEALGKELTMRKYQKTVLNTLFWCKVRTVHGQFGVITDDFVNTYASSNMQYMEIVKEKIVPEYLQLLFYKNPLTTYMDTLSIGADGRHFNKNVLLNVKIPIPPLKEQKSLVKKYQETIDQAKSLENQADETEKNIDDYIFHTLGIQKISLERKNDSILSLTFFNNLYNWDAKHAILNINPQTLLKSGIYKNIPIQTAFSINPITSIPKELDEISFLPMECISDIYGSVIEKRTIDSKTQGYTKFKDNDVIFAKITPCMQNGKCAVVKDLKQGYGMGSTEFHVFRAISDDVIPEYLHSLLRTKMLRKAAMNYFTGSSGQQRVSSEFIENLYIPLPPLPIQEEIVNHINQIKTQIKELRKQAQELREKAKKDFEGSVFE